MCDVRTMPVLPRSLRYHIVGIGGIGMSGLALLMHYRGYTVSGSDICDNELLHHLKSLGVLINIGHDACHADGADCVIRSAAVNDNNPEIFHARSLNKPVLSRAELLVKLICNSKTVCVSGSHGKTTTTAFIGSVMRCAGMDPTIICGGVMKEYGTNVVCGSDDWMVVEADESDGTCVKLPCNVAVLTNVRDEHGELLGGYEGIKKLFRDFVYNARDFSVLCVDDEYCRDIIRGRDIGCSLKYDADFTADNICYNADGTFFNVRGSASCMNDCFINMIGEYNVSNALCAIAACSALGISSDKIVAGLKKCRGVKRRQDFIGNVNGILFFDDYAHHPDEIVATLNALRYVAGNNKIIVVAQPHRFSRIFRCFDDFADALNMADCVAVTDVYSAGEDPGDFGNLSSLNLLEELRNKAAFTENADLICQFIKEHAVTGDVVVFMGAGDITYIARDVYNQIQKSYVG